jgi:hypothetical protein
VKLAVVEGKVGGGRREVGGDSRSWQRWQQKLAAVTAEVGSGDSRSWQRWGENFVKLVVVGEKLVAVRDCWQWQEKLAVVGENFAKLVVVGEKLAAVGDCQCKLAVAGHEIGGGGITLFILFKPCYLFFKVGGGGTDGSISPPGFELHTFWCFLRPLQGVSEHLPKFQFLQTAFAPSRVSLTAISETGSATSCIVCMISVPV